MKIDTSQLGKRVLKMAQRRNINLSQHEKREDKGDVIELKSENATDFVQELQDLANQHTNGDLSQIWVEADAEAYLHESPRISIEGGTSYSAGIESIKIFASFEREETDEEAARRAIAEYDAER